MFVRRSRILIMALFFSAVPCMVGAANWKPLPDTGQTECYNGYNGPANAIPCPADGQPLSGQDAQYQGLKLSFTDNGNGTVTDNNSRLMWQKSDDGVMRSWQDAVDYCAGLSLGGHSDWRLPARFELLSIAYYWAGTPAIDTSVFACTDGGRYWTSTADGADSTKAWHIVCSDAMLWASSKTSSHEYYSIYVRCVRP